MRFYTMITLLVVSAMLTACGGTAETNINVSAGNTTSVNSVNANTAPTATNATDGVRKPDAPTTNDAPTIKPTVLAYYEALRKKDDAGLKAVLIQRVIDSIQADMKEEKRTDFAGFVAEFETMPKGEIEVRNERVEGDRAVAEIKGGTYVNWTAMVFVKEGGQWKWTGDSPDIKSVEGTK